MASQLQPISVNGAGVDMSARMGGNSTVVASPATNAATAVGTIPAIQSAVVAATGIFIMAQVAYTVGTSGTAATYKIRQGTTAGSGTTLFNSGAITSGISAGNLVVENIWGLDTSPTLPGQAYQLELTITGGAATSTVSAIQMFYIIV
jgi:hypothetical protein